MLGLFGAKKIIIANSVEGHQNAPTFHILEWILPHFDRVFCSTTCIDGFREVVVTDHC